MFANRSPRDDASLRELYHHGELRVWTPARTSCIVTGEIGVGRLVPAAEGVRVRDGMRRLRAGSWVAVGAKVVMRHGRRRLRAGLWVAVVAGVVASFLPRVLHADAPVASAHRAESSIARDSSRGHA